MNNLENLITYKNHNGQDMAAIKKNDRLFDLTKIDGEIPIKDGSDGYYKERFTKDELLIIFDELKMWINK